MNIILVLFVIVVVGFIFWMVEKFVPMAPVFKYLLYGVMVIAILFWLLQGFGLIGGPNFKVR